MKKKTILIIFSLFIIFCSINSINATSYNTTEQADNNMLLTNNLGNTYEIDDSNYHIYFNSTNGKIYENSNILDGDCLKLGNISNKEFCLDKKLILTQMTSNDTITNSMIKLVSGSDNSIIHNIKILNNKSTSFKNTILLENSNNIVIHDCYLNSTNPIEYNIVVISSNFTTICNNTFVKKGINVTDNLILNINNNNFLDFEPPKVNTIISENLTKIEKNASHFEAKFLYVTPFSENDKVIFKINGIEYMRSINSEGIAKISINLGPGEYIIQSINPVTNEIKNNTITVLPRIVENNDLEKFYRNASQYWVKVLDDNGNPAKANETVTFNINGVFYNRTTNASGYVKLNINLQPGDYIITAEYKGCSVSNNIKVKSILSADDLAKKYGTPNQFKAKLLDGQGNPLANTNVTFNINGVFYNRTTDIDGTAKLNINLMAGEYIITSSYNGMNVANKVTVTA